MNVKTSLIISILLGIVLISISTIMYYILLVRQDTSALNEIALWITFFVGAALIEVPGYVYTRDYDIIVGTTDVQSN